VTEQWKDISEYKGIYQVSSLGSIRNVTTGTILKPKLDRQGYDRPNLYKETIPKSFFMHRLVMAAFEGVSDMPVNHKDLDKLNNSFDNLEYVTPRENSIHLSQSKGRLTGSIKSRVGRYEARIKIKGKLKALGTYDTREEASNRYFEEVEKLKNDRN